MMSDADITLTFTIGWLKPAKDLLLSSRFGFNFHHRVVETLISPLLKNNFSSFNFHHRVVETFYKTKSLEEKENFNFHHRVVETVFLRKTPLNLSL